MRLKEKITIADHIILPEGDYKAQIIAERVIDCKVKENGKLLELKFQIIEGPTKDVIIFESFPIEGKYKLYGYAKIAKLLYCINRETLSNTTNLLYYKIGIIVQFNNNFIHNKVTDFFKIDAS